MEELTTFLTSIGEEVEDAEEECFLLFAQDIPSANLGFVDSRATSVDVTIHGQDYTINQSPTLLSSSRAGGTTGAVLWKITPLFAEWITTQSNPFWTTTILTPTSTVLELGCGISGLIALALSPKITHYIATDQEYVHRLLRSNLETNAPSQHPRSKAGSHRKPSKHGPNNNKTAQKPTPNITFTTLDWETDDPALLKDSIANNDGNTGREDRGFDVLISCDCIYNEALIAPFVRTCADVCRLRAVYGAEKELGEGEMRPTVCVIAQQQRSPEVFEAWLRETMRVFRVWRVSDEVLGGKLASGSGYLVHVLVLKDGDL
ncbi:hypothetical protein F9C07_1865539 [Aspergillus flavus]|uniref:Diaminohydroxyphosphoribosylamino-pyrimidine deaminase n=1 Tax=Aspergillus flavus (strain ATCC 200026 / FGSC A1120 / IAM 13836 / NRRL 3357 / JCM 12722 / SRRC 167) TaxID=332952 RepID=A0A7G5KHQ8_ASPFN|nr:uncharacterized protein G4B84_010829 [Aspergillus flavus NRRL3357]KAJ1710368.1 hypothetical protein NYO67_7438 [Aspergillus flavus]KOC12258.1 hypothetical protein AFLA70_549g000370 [Aspergillus flavus AF70]QMW35338.1 hypothetical protein G4B84_010829 [Aspergillus flavus NRRL3357]QMW47400.1 hypothetical protein G4B11_010879 [Aspergillus flavus]QRD91745.1 hypothetical protein F9C07_1865539 [Aspergillus flavus]